MRRWVVSIALLCASCGPSEELPSTTARGPSVCSDGPGSPAATVHQGERIVGVAPNAIRAFGDRVWSVETGSNVVRGYRLGTEDTIEVDVGNERGPWDVWVGPEHVWITNFVANTVSVARRDTGEIITEITDERFDGPAGIAGLGDYIVVGNTEFREPGEYGPGSLVVIDRRARTVLGRKPTSAPNPQFMHAMRDGLLVVNSGVIAHDGTRYVAGSKASVEKYDVGANPLESEPATALFEPGDDRSTGVIGYPAYDPQSGVAYLASGTGPTVFKLDVESMQWLRGPDDPIRLYETEQNALHHAAMGPDGILYVTAFNRDQLFLVDTRCDAVLGEPVELETSQFLAGPHGAVVVGAPGGAEAWVSMSLANELTRVELRFQ